MTTRSSHGALTLDDVVASAQPFGLLDHVPAALAEWLLPMEWDREKLWNLRGLTRLVIPVSELRWLLGLPWWGDDTLSGIPWFRLAPSQVLAQPEASPFQYDRIVRADLGHPVHVIERHCRWIVLDGVHRLAKAAAHGLHEIQALVVTPSELATIVRPRRVPD